MSSSLNSKRTPALIQKRIDNQAQSYPPLDYSFHNAQKLEGRIIDFRNDFLMFINRCGY